MDNSAFFICEKCKQEGFPSIYLSKDNLSLCTACSNEERGLGRYGEIYIQKQEEQRAEYYREEAERRKRLPLIIACFSLIISGIIFLVRMLI